MENRRSVDQRRLQVSEFFNLHSKDLARQGSLVASYRTRGGERVGPYFRLTFRDADQRQVSIYVGCDEALIADVRERLNCLQNPVRERRQWAGIRRSMRRAARDASEQLRTELGKKGLLLKGHEIRGWRGRRRQDLDVRAPSPPNPPPSLSAPQNPTPHEE